MRAALLIASHHLKRVIHKPGLLLLLIAVPFTLALIEYAAFGKTVAVGKLPPVQILFLDEDDSLASRFLFQALSADQMREFIQARSVGDREEAKRMFQKNQASALVVTPAGFGSHLLDGQEAEIQFYGNPVQTFSPQIAASALEMLVLIANQLYGEVAEPLKTIKSFTEGDVPTSEEGVARVAVQFFQGFQKFGKLGSLQDLEVKLQRPDRSGEPAVSGSTPGRFFAFIFPGLLIFALFFISQILAVRLLRDRMRGLQRRILMTRASRGSILFGGILYLVAALFVLLLVVGFLASLVFGIQLRDPLSLLILTLGVSVFIAGLQLTIIGMAKTDRGASFAAGVIIMFLALLGGTFIPAENYPPFFQALAFRIPNGAAQQGIIDVLVHHRSLGEIGSHVITTWIWATIFLWTAIRAEGRRLKIG